jgi:hypothetical protein
MQTRLHLWGGVVNSASNRAKAMHGTAPLRLPPSSERRRMTAKRRLATRLTPSWRYNHPWSEADEFCAQMLRKHI